VDSAEYNQRLLAVVKAIGEGEEAYRQAIAKAANSERAYRRRQAISRQQIRGEAKPPKNADEINDRAELLEFADGATVGDLRYQRDLDRGMEDAAKISLRAKTQEMSALQSEASLAKSEAEFIRSGPQVGP
jgi:hypothetical protein